MIDVILWFLILLPMLMMLEAKRSVRRYIFSGKLFFAPTHERAMSNRTILFLALWLCSVPLSVIAFIILMVRWA